MTRPAILYGAAAALLLAEAAVFGLSLVPNVDPAYRAFYIDRTTDCYPLPVSGQYALGTWLGFDDASRPLRDSVTRCGWRDPAREGSWTDGQLTMLRFRIGDLASDLVLEIEARPYIDGQQKRQLVELSANGVALAPLRFNKPNTTTMQLAIPSAAVAAGNGLLDLELRFPNARSPYDLGLSPTDKRIYGLFVYKLRLSAAS